MVDVEDRQQQPSTVRQGLALICVGAIGAVIGLLGRHEDAGAFDEGPSLAEMAAQIIGGFGILLALIGLAIVAWGLLRD